jgi:diguanylate cyclase (GGDEF)-like protein
MAMSLLALLVAAGAAVLWPQSLRQYSSLAWLLALVPCMLLAYHKGWKGAAGATAMTMATIAMTQALLVVWLQTAVDWRLLGIAVLTFLSVSLVVGLLSQLHLRDRQRDAGAAYADVETGLPNQRILDLFLIRYFATARRGQDLAAVAFEIDHLDEYRTRRGAKAATRAVSAFARVLDSNTRVMDICSRYEDNLFVCLLPKTGNGGAFTYALRVRKEVESSALLKGTGISVSGGVASYMPAMNHRTDLIVAAREALSAAIGEGRNRVMVCVPARDEDQLESDVTLAPWSADGAADTNVPEPDVLAPEPDVHAPEPDALDDAGPAALRRKRKAPVKTSLLTISRRRRR